MIHINNDIPETRGWPVMVDNETLGTGANSAVISIGACQFDPDTQSIGSTFHAIINKQSLLDLGCTTDQSTIDWWEKQSDEAKAGSYSYPNGTDIRTVLLAFYDWMGGEKSKATLWGNGSDFDNAQLAELYRKAGIPQPWAFWNNRCYRTMKNMFPGVSFQRHGTHHNALDDAVTQAKHLMLILRRMRNGQAALG